MNTLPRRYTGVPGFNVENDDAPTPSVPPSLLDNFELISDLARYGEGLFTRDQVKKKWRKLITNEMWDLLGSNDALVDAIEAEKVRRVRDGSAKREKAQQHVVAAPDILNGIMSDPKQSAKHRIDSAKALDQFAGNAPDAVEQDRIIIRIDMGADVRAKGGTPNPADVLVFEASPNQNNTIDATPQELPPPRRGPGRPPGSKNKPKELQQRNDSDG